MFSSELPDLQSMIKKLDMFDENVNQNVRNTMNSASNEILNEQKRLILTKSKKLADAISCSGVYTTKKSVIGVKIGYQSGAFEDNGAGFNAGVIGTMYEFGRPGQSSSQRSKTTMTQIRNGKEVTVRKGTISAIPHIRRGFDNKVESAAKKIVEAVDKELKKL
jgi:hypothetical protein